MENEMEKTQLKNKGWSVGCTCSSEKEHCSDCPTRPKLDYGKTVAGNMEAVILAEIKKSEFYSPEPDAIKKASDTCAYIGRVACNKNNT